MIACAFVVVFAATVVASLAVLANSGKSNPFRLPAPSVSTAIVFQVPLAEYSAILKNCSMTELQYNSTMKRWEAHKMVDLEAQLGAAVLAPYAGVVTKVQDHQMQGRQVTIKHRDGLETVLSNLSSETVVREGDSVSMGQRVGTVGMTSNIEFTSTPHLRVEVLKNGKRIDPNDYIDFPIK
jgi:murein DD-endopeptidase MepM/ murein hydrolase activator NlpD